MDGDRRARERAGGRVRRAGPGQTTAAGGQWPAGETETELELELELYPRLGLGTRASSRAGWRAG